MTRKGGWGGGRDKARTDEKDYRRNRTKRIRYEGEGHRAGNVVSEGGLVGRTKPIKTFEEKNEKNPGEGEKNKSKKEERGTSLRGVRVQPQIKRKRGLGYLLTTGPSLGVGKIQAGGVTIRVEGTGEASIARAILHSRREVGGTKAHIMLKQSF